MLTLLFAALLSSDDFATREAAERCCPVAAAAQLAHSADAEVRLRAARVIERHQEASRQARLEWLERELGVVGRPLWIDGLPLDYPERGQLITYYLGRQHAPYSGPEFPAYYLAAREYFADLVDGGTPLDDVRRLLHATAARCRRNPSGYWNDLTIGGVR